MEDEINLADIIKVVNKYKKLIIGLVLVSVIFTFFQSIGTPKQYKATATILPLEGGTGSLITSAFGAFGGIGGGGGSGRLVAILKSKTLAKNVIVDLGLLKAGTDLESAAASFAGGIDAKPNKDGLLEISFTGDDTEMPARIVNSYISKMGDFINSRSLNVNFQTIDPAVPPASLISQGKTKQNMLMAALASAFVGMVLAFALDYLKKMSPLKGL